MYERFFNLREKPFNLTPSSRYLYLGEAHKEALALLRYGIIERKGFVLLTGEVGTGKTTMAQAFLAEMDRRVHCVYLSNPLLAAEDLYNYLAFSAFRKRAIYRSKAAFIVDFEAFLRDCLKNRKAFVLIIDEAQGLSYELLEEIRLLSNIETAEEKLINIFLIGQPELNEKLSDPRCRPLLQRISIRHHIKPLNLKETVEYLWTRLRVGGVDEMGSIFPRKVAEAIYEYSQGYPRVINVLADNVLLLSFSKNERKIRPELVKQCYDDMKLEGSFPARDQAEEAQEEEESVSSKLYEPDVFPPDQLDIWDLSPIEFSSRRSLRAKSQKVFAISKRRSKGSRLLIFFLVLAFLGFEEDFATSDKLRTVISRIGTYLPKNAVAWFAPQATERTTEVNRADQVSPSLLGGSKNHRSGS